MECSDAKILSRDEVVTQLRIKFATKKICFTSGVFDLLHSGHVKYLQQAKSLADVLVVGLNSDASVRANKGPKRPINSQSERAQVLAALACVDFVFIFDEVNNNQNIQLFKPDIYAKAGDYSLDKLSSADIVKQYGGRIELIPFVEGLSSSSIIKKIIDIELDGMTSFQVLPAPTFRPAVFIDRDGTINQSVEYLSEPEKFKLLPGVLDALRIFNRLAYRVVIVTNQPGIGIGYFSREDFYLVNRVMLKAFGQAGIKVDKVYFCPHSHAEDCLCRKPKTAMIDRAVRELNIDLAGSVVIGDTTLDLQLAKNVGIKSILVKTGQAGSDNIFNVTADRVCEDLLDAAKYLEQMK